MKNCPHRLKNMEEARSYVVSVVGALLEAEFMNGSAWLHMHSGADEGNLANLASERRAHRALRELMILIEKRET